MRASGKNASCRAAMEALLVPPTTVAATEAGAAHRRSCPRCAEAAADTDLVRQAIMGAGDELDEIRRARGLERLGPVLEGRRPVERARPRWLSLRPHASAAAALAVMAVGLGAVLMLRHHRQPAERSVPDRRILVPVGAEVAGAHGSGTTAPGVDRLEVPEGSVARSRIAGRAELVLTGPALLTVTRAEPGCVELNLRRGALVAHYERAAGGRLLVVAPRVAVEVVGTTFTTEVDARGATSVAVDEGEVEVRPASGARLRLMAGNAWEEDRGGTAISPRQRALLHRLSNVVIAAGPSPASLPGTASDSAKPRQPRAAAPKPGARQSPPTRAAGPSPPPAPGQPSQRPAGPRKLDSIELYQRAERAMSRGDRRAARLALEELVLTSPDAPVASQARYDLARLCQDLHDTPAAIAYLGGILAQGKETVLFEPASYLRCQLELQNDDPQVPQQCLHRFREQFPDSPHDEAALDALLRLTRDCRQRQALIHEYLARYPMGPAAEALRADRHGCQ